jgi:hypothetical protein
MTTEKRNTEEVPVKNPDKLWRNESKNTQRKETCKREMRSQLQQIKQEGKEHRKYGQRTFKQG